MYIFKCDLGEFRQAPDNFDPDNPDFEMLKDVSEVLCVNKVLVKQMKLVVKSKEEREVIRNKQQQNQQKAKRGLK